MAIPTPLIYHNAGIGGLEDISGNGRHLSAFNGAVIVDDVETCGSRAFHMGSSTTDAHFRDDGFRSLDGETEATVSAWFKHDGSSGKQVIVANHGINKGNVMLYVSGGKVYFFNGYFDVLSGATNPDTEKYRIDTALSADQWYHVVFTFNGAASSAADRMAGYLNGSLASGTRTQGGSGLNAIQNSNVSGFDCNYAIGAVQEVSLGGSPTGNIYYDFKGSVDSVRMWNTLLTPSQISDLSICRDAGNFYGANRPLMGVGR